MAPGGPSRQSGLHGPSQRGCHPPRQRWCRQILHVGPYETLLNGMQACSKDDGKKTCPRGDLSSARRMQECFLSLLSSQHASWVIIQVVHSSAALSSFPSSLSDAITEVEPCGEGPPCSGMPFRFQHSQRNTGDCSCSRCLGGHQL